MYLGLDSSTQSLSAIVLEVEGDSRRVVFESSIVFDDTFPEYRTNHGVLPSDDPTTAAIEVATPAYSYLSRSEEFGVQWALGIKGSF